MLISVFHKPSKDLGRFETDFNTVNLIPQHGWMRLLNLAALGYPGQRILTCTKAGFLLYNHLLLYKYIFVEMPGKEYSKSDPRSLQLCMTMNKSMHKMLIHGTMCSLS